MKGRERERKRKRERAGERGRRGRRGRGKKKNSPSFDAAAASSRPHSFPLCLQLQVPSSLLPISPLLLRARTSQWPRPCSGPSPRCAPSRRRAAAPSRSVQRGARGGRARAFLPLKLEVPWALACHQKKREREERRKSITRPPFRPAAGASACLLPSCLPRHASRVSSRSNPRRELASARRERAFGAADWRWEKRKKEQAKLLALSLLLLPRASPPLLLLLRLPFRPSVLPFLPGPGARDDLSASCCGWNGDNWPGERGGNQRSAFWRSGDGFQISRPSAPGRGATADREKEKAKRTTKRRSFGPGLCARARSRPFFRVRSLSSLHAGGTLIRGLLAAPEGGRIAIES